MPQFEFTLRIDKRLSDEDVMDAIYARCQDASLLVEGETTLLEFYREADSLQDAIATAIGDVNQVGYHVAQIELPPEAVATQSV